MRGIVLDAASRGSDKEVKGPSTLAPFADVACLTLAPSAGIMASHTKAQRRPRSASKDLGNGSAQRGDIVEAKIKDITDEALLLELDSAFQPKVPVVAKVHITDVADLSKFDEATNTEVLTAKFSVGQSVAARVLWSTFVGAASHNGKGEKGERAIAAGEQGQRVMHLSMRKSDLASGANIGARLTWRTKDAIAPGSTVHGVVREVNGDGRGSHFHRVSLVLSMLHIAPKTMMCQGCQEKALLVVYVKATL